MRIAIHSQGDWNDAEVTPETLRCMLDAGELQPSRTNTGEMYGETSPLPIYESHQWPGWPSGFAYIPNAPDHGLTQ